MDSTNQLIFWTNEAYPCRWHVLTHYLTGLTRWGALGLTGVAVVGLLKLNLAGPGLTATVKELWKGDPKKQ